MNSNIPNYKPLYKPVYLPSSIPVYLPSNKPVYQPIKLRRNIDYEMKCIYCKSTEVIMSSKLELQYCCNCNSNYIPKILELK
jgi:hypothetical protein